MRLREVFFAMRARLSFFDTEDFSDAHFNSGKIAVATVLGTTALAALIFFVMFEVRVPEARADDVSTSVTVLNTPPQWTLDAEETAESSTSTPTNAGATISWTARATDSNNDDYFLLICKASSTPTATSNAPPECGGGVSNRWARSATTTSASDATASTSTIEYFPFDQEGNAWYAYVCDANASLARCNGAMKQGRSTYGRFSPFVMNHPPVFSAVVNDGPEDPGGTVTWTSTAYDNDATGTPDTVQLFVCKSNDFNGTYCGAGGSWATSTFAASNAATTTTLTTPLQDKSYNAYVYMIDSHGLVATSTIYGSNSTFSVNNVAPAVDGSTITLIDSYSSSNPVPGGSLTLWQAVSTSGPYRVHFTATDNNSCLNSSGGAETTFAVTAVYRSGVGQTGCDTASEYNANNCYAATSTLFTGFPSGMTCAATTTGSGACSGASDPTVDWECTFPLWYIADPTDASTPWTSERWEASVRIQDDNAASSTLTADTTDDSRDVESFLAFNVSSTSVLYGSLEPGQQLAVSTTSDLIAQGNVGLDEDIYGDTMCTDWTVADSCDAGGIDSTREIPISNQKVATTSVAYSHAEAYSITASTSPLSFEIRVPKTTSTSSPQTKYNYWGINIPSAITLAGSYTGQNTITGKKSNSSFW